MALNLAIHLHTEGQPPLLVWNRSQGRVDKFLELAEEGKDGKHGVPVEVAKSVEEVGESQSDALDFYLQTLTYLPLIQSVTSCSLLWATTRPRLRSTLSCLPARRRRLAPAMAFSPVDEARAASSSTVSTLPGMTSPELLDSSASLQPRPSVSHAACCSSPYGLNTESYCSDPTTAGDLERLASKKPSRHFISAPTFGRPEAAAGKTLLFAVAGEYHAKKHATRGSPSNLAPLSSGV